MLKLKPRTNKHNEVISKYYYIRGSILVDGSPVEINWTKTDIPITKKITPRFEEKFCEDWKEDYKRIHGSYKIRKYKDALDELLSDPHEKPSKQDKRNLQRSVEYLGSFPLSKINNKLIGQKAMECYQNIKQYADLRFNEQDRDTQIEISSKHATVNRNFINAVSKIMHYASDNNWCNYLRIKHFPTLSGRNRPKYYFTLEEIQRCLETCNDYQIKLLLVFMLYTGARLQEALNVSWKGLNYTNNRPQIDLEQNKIFIWQGKQQDGRVVEIHPTLKEWLIKINNREDRLFEWESLDQRKKTDWGLSNRWNKMLDDAGVDRKKKRREVRHTYTTNLINYADVSDAQLMDLGGWKTRDMISVYGSTIPEETAKKINLLP